MIIITVLEKASQRRPLSRQLSDKLWVCERWPLQGAMKVPWDGQCVDGNGWLHNKVSLGIIGSSLENYALRLNVMIQGWSLKTELWYVFLFNVIIHIKKMLKSFMINIIVTSFRILEDNYDTLWEKKHFFRKSQTGLFKHSFLTSGHVSLMFIIDFLGHDKRWCLETNMYWFKTWVRFDSKQFRAWRRCSYYLARWKGPHLWDQTVQSVLDVSVIEHIVNRNCPDMIIYIKETKMEPGGHEGRSASYMVHPRTFKLSS